MQLGCVEVFMEAEVLEVPAPWVIPTNAEFERERSAFLGQLADNVAPTGVEQNKDQPF
jgi:hypothetical protein